MLTADNLEDAWCIIAKDRQQLLLSNNSYTARVFDRSIADSDNKASWLPTAFVLLLILEQA